MTRRLEQRAALDDASRRLEAVLGAIAEVLLSVEVLPDGRLLPAYVGPGLERLLGGPVPPRVDAVTIWSASIHPEDRPAFGGALSDLAAGEPVDMEYRVVGLDNRTRWVRWSAHPRALGDGRLIVDGILSDVTERRLLAVRLASELSAAERAARHDQLTGIANRVRLREVIGRALEAERDGLALLLLDVDRFKGVNDTYGHHVGDQVLVEVARRLSGAVREQDLVGRWGGEEFCVVIDRVRDDATLRRIGDGLRRALAAVPFPTDAGPLRISASFGAARPAATTDVDGLLEEADRALYAAKAGGRNRVVLVGDLDADGAAPPLPPESDEGRARLEAA